MQYVSLYIDNIDLLAIENINVKKNGLVFIKRENNNLKYR